MRDEGRGKRVEGRRKKSNMVRTAFLLPPPFHSSFILSSVAGRVL
jgi:hypothetical protein